MAATTISNKKKINESRYRDITTRPANGDQAQHQSLTTNNMFDEGSTIIKFETGEYEVIRSKIYDNHIIQTTTNTLQQQISQSLYRYSKTTTTSLANGDDITRNQSPTTTIVHKHYEDDGVAIIEFEAGEYEIIKSEIDENQIIQTSANALKHQYSQHQTISQSPQRGQQQELNETMTETVSIPAGGTLHNVKQKRKKRPITSDIPCEYLEKMSVKGIDMKSFEQIVDGVSYCLVCAKNDIYTAFKSRYNLKRHVSLLHEGGKRKFFACPICNKIYSRPDNMKIHKRDKHCNIALADPSIRGDDVACYNAIETPPPTKRSRNSVAKSPKHEKASKTPSNMNNNEIILSASQKKYAAAKYRLPKI